MSVAALRDGAPEARAAPLVGTGVQGVERRLDVRRLDRALERLEQAVVVHADQITMLASCRVAGVARRRRSWASGTSPAAMTRGLSSSGSPQPATSATTSARAPRDRAARRRRHAGTTGSSTTKRAPSRAVGPVLDPHPPAVQADVLGDEGEAEADALARARAGRRRRRGRSGRRSARARRAGTPGPESSTAICTASSTWRRLTAGGAVAVLGGVVEQVGDDPGEAALVGPHDDAGELGVELDRARRGGPTRRRPGARTRRGGLVEVEAHGAGVVAADLEQVLDELAEAADLGVDEVDGLRAALGRGRRAGVSSTSTAAAIVMSGDRSSWLTSEANRASRSMRSWSAWAMSLNDDGERRRGRGRRWPRAGCRGGRRRWPRRPRSRRPAGAAPAGWPTSPRAAPATVVTTPTRRAARCRGRAACPRSRTGRRSRSRRRRPSTAGERDADGEVRAAVEVVAHHAPAMSSLDDRAPQLVGERVLAELGLRAAKRLAVLEEDRVRPGERDCSELSG